MIQLLARNNDIFTTHFRFLLRTGILSVLLACITDISAQLSPTHNAKLTGIHVLFQWETGINIFEYVLNITDKSTGKVLTYKSPLPSIIVKQGLEWGHAYDWNVTAYSEGKKKFVTPNYHFEILQNYKINPDRYRHLVTQNTLTTDSLYIFLDNPGVVIDLKGNPVWFYPDTNVARVFNLQVLPNGNFAAMKPKYGKSGNENLMFEEISYEGKIIWRTPSAGGVSGDTSEYYHHDFQVLKNGNYLVMGNQFKQRTLQGGTFYIRYGTLMEYNREGKVVWSWNSADYLKDEDLFTEGIKDNPAHLNAVWLDEKTEKMLISFRYIDRFILLDKKTKKVEATFGSLMPSGEAKYANGFFHRQHSPKFLHNNSTVLLYDNGTGTNNDTISSLLILSLPQGNEKSHVLYRFPMQFAGRKQSWSESKGDVDAITSSHYLIDMGAIPRTVIIDTTKGIVWECNHQSKPNINAQWMGVEENYRADWSSFLFPNRWALSIGLGEKGSGKEGKKLASYPMVLYCMSMREKVRIELYNPLGEKVFSDLHDFSQGDNFRFFTATLPRKGKKQIPIGKIVVKDPITGMVRFYQDIRIK